MKQKLTWVVYTGGMAGRPSSKEPSETGARIARLRKEAGLSQVKLADALGIPQRTLSYYEREADHLPSTLILPMAKALGVTTDELIGTDSGKRKPGPTPKLQQQIEQLKQLPKSKQKFVSEFLDTVLQQAHS